LLQSKPVVTGLGDDPMLRCHGLCIAFVAPLIVGCEQLTAPALPQVIAYQVPGFNDPLHKGASSDSCFSYQFHDVLVLDFCAYANVVRIPLDSQPRIRYLKIRSLLRSQTLPDSCTIACVSIRFMLNFTGCKLTLIRLSASERTIRTESFSILNGFSETRRTTTA
jgi:hypothetical protein